MIGRLLRLGIFSAVISLLVGIAAWVFTRDTMSSLMVALLTETLILVFDIRIDLVNEFESLFDVARLKDLVVDGTRESELVRGLIRNFSATQACGEPFFVDRANEVLVEASNELHNLRFGRMEVDPSLVQIKGAWILENLRANGFATALIRLDTFWFPESGQHYHDETMTAAKRGIPITRVFIIDSREIEINENFLEIMREQEKSGIDVRVAYGTDIPPDLALDFGIWDDRIVAYVNTSPNSNRIVGATFFSQEAELLRARRMRDRIMQASISLRQLNGMAEA